MSKGTKSAENEVFYTLIPATQKDRIYSMGDIWGIQICFGIAAWFFLIGSQTGMWLPAKTAIPTVIFGNCFALLLMAPIAIISARYGVEQMQGTIPIFGQRFTPINLAMFYVTVFCGLALATLMFGKGAVKFWTAIFGPDHFLSQNYYIWALLCLILGLLVAYLGPDTMKWLINAAAVFMVIVLIGLVIYLFKYHGVREIFNAKPAAPIVIDGNPALSHRWNIAAAFEINVGLGLSWTYWYGQWTRLAKTEGAAYHGCMWGWGALSAIAGVFSALAALAIGQYDPTVWLVEVGKNTGITFLPIIGLLLMAVANIMAVTTLIYPGAVSFRTHYPKVRWNTALAVSSVPALALILIPGFYDSIASIYSLVGALCVLYGAIIVVDYHFITKGVYDIRRTFNKKEGYMYWHGFNPAALIAWICGAVFYLWTFNPFTITSPSGWFPYITAGVPTCVLTGLIYYVLMKSWVMKVWPQPLKLEK